MMFEDLNRLRNDIAFGTICWDNVDQTKDDPMKKSKGWAGSDGVYKDEIIPPRIFFCSSSSSTHIYISSLAFCAFIHRIHSNTHIQHIQTPSFHLSPSLSRSPSSFFRSFGLFHPFSFSFNSLLMKSDIRTLPLPKSTTKNVLRRTLSAVRPRSPRDDGLVLGLEWFVGVQGAGAKGAAV